jgi:hypothetical protein
MIQPNWFDKKYEAKLNGASAQQILKLIAEDDRVQKAVNVAIETHDKNAAKPGWAGPSRAQTARSAIAECLASQA